MKEWRSLSAERIQGYLSLYKDLVQRSLQIKKKKKKKVEQPPGFLD